MGQHQVCFLLRFSYNAINKSLPALPELLPGERKHTSKQLLVFIDQFAWNLFQAN